jgi:hypothetical protein
MTKTPTMALPPDFPNPALPLKTAMSTTVTIPLFGTLDLDRAQRRRLRRVLGFVWGLVFDAWNFPNLLIQPYSANQHAFS